MEPILELEGGKLKSLKIKQGLSLRGKNRLRKQKFDIALFSSENGGEPLVIKDVVISEKEAITEVDLSSLPTEFTYAASFLNHDEHAYAKVRFDAQSVDWLVENLHLIKDAVNRAAIWRYFWQLIMDKQLTSLKYIEFVKKQLPAESVDQIIQVALMNLSGLISCYIPQETVKETKADFFRVLVSLLGKEGVSKVPIVDALFGFISNKAHIEEGLKWLEQAKITADGKDLHELALKHKYAILKVLFKSPEFDSEFKHELLEKTIGEDKSDIAANTRAVCRASLPDPEIKAQVWAEITDTSSTESLYLRRSKMAGFYSWDQLDLLAPYFEKFYEVLPELSEKTTYKYLDTFFHSMLPRMHISDSHIVKLVSLKLQTADNE